MRTVRLLFHCIKDGLMGFVGGDPHGRRGVVGGIILIIYFPFVAFIIVQGRNEQLLANKMVYILLAGTAIYFVILLLGAFLFDFFLYILLKKRKK